MKGWATMPQGGSPALPAPAVLCNGSWSPGAERGGYMERIECWVCCPIADLDLAETVWETQGTPIPIGVHEGCWRDWQAKGLAMGDSPLETRKQYVRA